MANFHRITPGGDYYTNGAVIDEIALGTTYSVQLNGSSQYITSSGGAAYQLSGDFTVEFWMYATTPRQTNAIIICRNAAYTATNNMYLMFPSGSSKIALNKNGIGSVFGSVATLSLNTWYHIAFVRSGSGTNNLSLYINGALDSSITETSTWDWSNICIGSNPSDGGLPVATLAYGGYLSNLRIVKGTALYSAPFQSPAIPLNNLTNTSLLTFQSSTIIDNGTANTGGTGFTISNPASATVSSSIVPTAALNRVNPDGSFYTTLFDEVSLSTPPYSVQFNGSSQYLTATGSQTPGLTSENFTIECWFRLTGLTFSYPGGRYGACILNASNSPFTGGNGGVWLYISGTLNNPTDIGLSSSGSTVGPQVSATTSISLNVWHHLAISRNGSNMAIWLDGQKLNTTSSLPTSSYAAYPISIGVTTHSTAYAMYFPGYISNLRIVKGTPVYDPTGGNIVPPAAPLTAVSGTYLLTCQSPTIIDNSTNGFAISNPATATVDYGTTALYRGSFNGTSQYLSIASNTPLTFGTGDFTIEFWINVTAAPVASALIYDPRPASTQGVYTLLYLNSDRTMRFWVSSLDRITSSALTLNTWYHVALVKSSSVTTMYLNGAVTGSTYSDTNSYLASATNIAAGYAAGASITSFFSGYLSNLRVVKGTAVYTSAFTTPVAPLAPISNTSLLTLQSPGIIDNSINQFTITNPNAVTVQAPLSYASKRAYSNGALQIVGQFDDYTTITQTYSGYFNGSSSNIALGSNALIDIFGTSGSATVEFWYYSISATQIGHLFIAGPNGTNRTYLISQGSSLTLGTAIGGTYTTRITSGVSVVQNTWYHVAISRSGSTYTLYVNGQSQGSSSVSLYNNGGAGVPWYIGVQAYSPLAADWYNGYISNFRIVNGLALYTQNFTPTVSPLPKIGTTAMLTLQNATVVDNSGSGVSITPTSISVSNTIVPF